MLSSMCAGHSELSPWKLFCIVLWTQHTVCAK